MGKIKNIQGNKYNLLTVIGIDSIDKHGKVKWLCECECGNKAIVTGSKLVNGKTKSCGCLKTNERFTNLSGVTINNVDILEYIGRNKSNKPLYKCKCHCGTEFITVGSRLKTGHTKSCGCLNHRRGKDNPRYNHNLSDEDRQRTSPEYVKWRAEVYEMDKFTCQCCNKSGGDLNAHHLKSYSRFPELKYDINNGVTMCTHCHVEFHKQYGYNDFTGDDYYEFKTRKEGVE